MNENSALEQIYQNHHRKSRKEFFAILADERGDFLKKNIGSGKKVLDIGCRDGALTSYYSKGNTVLGLDIDSEALGKASKTLQIETKKVDLNGEWGVPQNHFDIVVAAEVVEHLYFPSQVLRKAYDSLKPGGLILGSVPNAFSLKNRIKYLFGIKKGTPLSDPTHINQFSRKEFLDLLRKDFKEATIEPLGRFAFFDRFFPGLFSFDLLFRAKK